MGFNTTVVVLNDALHEIKNDPDFGRKLYDAVLCVQRGPQDVSAGNHCNAVSVIESHHADGFHLIAVGGNYGLDLGYVGSWQADPDQMLRALADRRGYRLVKKPKKRDLGEPPA